MRGIRRKLRPSPAMMVACIALAIALSGVGYAAVTIPRNSVGTAQLKKSAVVSSKIAPGGVNSAKVLDRSLKAVDFALGQLPPGSQGAQGLTGLQGAQGLTGPQGAQGLSTGAAGGGLAGNYPNPTIALNAVAAAQIATDAVGSSEIDDGSIRESDVGVLTNGLRGNNIGVVSFIRLNVPLPSIPAGACLPVNDDAGSGSSVLAIAGDFVIPFRPVGFPNELILQPTVNDTDTRAVFEVCNRSAGAVDAADTFDIGILAIRPA